VKPGCQQQPARAAKLSEARNRHQANGTTSTRAT
jgi:hypothetical protein